MINNDFEESKHPRDEKGQFTKKEDSKYKNQDLKYSPLRKWAVKFQTEKLERQRERERLSGKLTREAQRKDFDEFYKEYGHLFDEKEDARKYHTIKKQEYRQLTLKRLMAENSYIGKSERLILGDNY